MKKILPLAVAGPLVLAWLARTVTAETENFLPNGSFELAANPSYPDFWGCYWSANFVPFHQVQGRDDTTAVAGRWSHRIGARPVDFMGSQQFRGSEINVSSEVPAANQPVDYVLSAYLKADRDDMRVRLYGVVGEKEPFTEARLTRDWKRYAVRVPLDEQIKATVREHNGPVWEDDCVELFVDAAHGHNGFRQFAVNPINTRCCRKSDDPTWGVEWESGVAKESAFWTAELRVPLAALGLTTSVPTVWGVNFCRENHQAGEYSTW